MGGFGCGRRATEGKSNTVEDALALDIRLLGRRGALSPGGAVTWQWTTKGRVRASVQIHTKASQVALTFSHTPRWGPAEIAHQTILLETTACNLGGTRSWFSCPHCGRRVAIIYGSGRHFTCRRCTGLAYASQRQSDDARAARRVDRLRKRLGWLPGILNGPGAKPKGMHWRIYWQLTAEHEQLAGAVLQGMARQLGQVDRALAKASAWLDRAR